MRSRPTDLLAVVRVALVLAAIGVASACIIGPKQDDPVGGDPKLSLDTGPPENVSDTASATTSPDGSSDHVGDAAGESPAPPADTGCVTDADAACGDAAADARTDAPIDAKEGG